MDTSERSARTWAGLFSLGLGLFLMYVVWSAAPGLRVPPVIGYLAASTFALAGATLLLQSRGRHRAALVATFLLVAALAGVGGWIGFGPGSRSCGGELGVLTFIPGETLCRVVFGGGAVLTAMIALVILRSLLHKADEGDRISR